MRLFIAVNFPMDTLKKIEDISTFFKKQTPQNTLKWVDTAHLHLTIKFIGEVNESKLAQIKSILTTSLESQPLFNIEVSGLGMYPHKDKPRVIWLGITGGEPLVEMHKILDQNLASVDIPQEGRAFSPHLTIARVRKNADLAAVKLLGMTLSHFTVDPLGLITIDRVNLYQSNLTPSGPIYTRLLSIPLNQV